MFKLMRISIILISVFSIYGQDLSTLRKLSVEKSPMINLLKAKHKAAENKIPQVSNLADPKLVFGFNNLPLESFAFDEEAMTSKSVALSQAFPFPGKLKKAEEVVSADMPIIDAEINEASNKIIWEVSETYFKMLRLIESKNKIRENRQLYEALVEIVRIKYRVSKSTQQDIFKLELKLDRLEEMLVNLDTDINFVRDKIENYIYDKFLNENFSFDYLITDYQIQTKEKYYEAAKQNRPLLKGVEARIKKANNMLSLSEYSFYPDFNLTLQYSQRDELKSTGKNLNDFLSLRLGMNLPLNYGGKNDARVAEAKSYVDVFAKQYEQLMQLIKISVDKSHNTLTNRLSTINLYNEKMLPKAYISLEAAMGSYKASRADIMDVINSIEQILDLEIKTIKSKYDFLNELSRLEFLTGTEINMLSAGGNDE